MLNTYKPLNKFLLVILMMGIIATNALGQSASITINNASIGGSGVLGSNNYNSGAERTWTQGGVSFGGKAITCNISGTPSGATACQHIQAQANNGVIYNTTALPGRIISIQFNGTASVATSCFGGTARLVNSTSANYTVGGTQIGTAQTNTTYTWSTTGSENYTFFCIKRGATAQYFSSIVITYETQTTPSAPTISSITPDNGQLSVNFTAPSSNGGSAITNYKYSTDGGTTFNACSPAQTTSPILVSGLTNGNTYAVQIRAVNANGDGTASTSTNATPRTTPNAPSITTITPGNAQLSVAFTAGSDGGSAITNYKYSTDNGASFTACSPAQTSSPILITGLTNGVPYDVQIKAVNIAGDGVASSTSTETPTTSGPVITISNVSASPIDFGVTSGLNATASDNYTITGSNLTSDVVVTAPTNFEVSKDDNTFSSSVSYTQSGGTLPINSFVYVRFKPSSINGVNSGNITHTSTGATTENVSVTGIALATEPTVTSSITFGTKTTNSVVVNFTGGNGSNRILAVKSGSAVSYTPVDGAVVSGVNSIFTSATDQGSGNRIVYSGTGNTVTITGLTSNTTYHFALFEFNEGTGTSQNYLNTAATANTYIFDNAVYASDNLGTDLTQDFSTLVSSGTSSTLPTGWFFNETGTNANTTYTAGTGSATTGETYSFGATGNSERSFGSLNSGSLSSVSIGTRLINTTGETITSLNVTYTGEQWRLGATGRSDKLDFQYSTDATSLTTGTWTDVNTLDFSSPVTTGTTGILDGNLTANRTTLTSTISNISVTNNSSIWFRWVDSDITGTDDALAIDDVILTPFSTTATNAAGSIAGASLNNLNINDNATLQGNVVVAGKINFESGKKVILNGNTLTINGTVTGTPTIVGNATSSIILGGTGTVATLNFDQTTPGTTNKLKDVTINRTGTTVTLGNALQIADNGTVTVSAGTLASSGNLTLTSTLSGTGRIAELGAGASITGNVEIQRYMVGGASSQRGWRCMSTPVSGGTYAQLIDDIFITGPGGTTNGFDANGSNSSVLYYEESATRGWKSITNTSDTWAAGKGALVFFRGDRTQTTSLTNTSIAPNSFALDYIGSINSGDITVALDYNSSGLAADQGWNLIGNPYPSQIDWANVNRSINTDDYYYILNPNTKNYVSQNTGALAVGQAFFVLVDAATSITFQENDKTASNGTAYFKTAVNPLTVKMKLDNVQYDVATLNFKSNTSTNYVFKEDAIKLKNSVYNVAFVTTNNKEVQSNVVNYLGTTGTDTFDLNITSTTNTNYTLSLSNFDEIPLNKAILLIDKLNNNVVNIRVTPDYTFTINNTTPSTFGKRFALVITDQINPLPVKLTAFSGKKVGKLNQLNWISAAEKNMIAYEVERSNDGKIFETIGLVKATNTNTTQNYVFTDLTTKNSTAFYRLKMVDNKGSEYSNVITINAVSVLDNLAVYPNPATNVLFIKTPQNEVIDNIKVFDLNGTIVLEEASITQLDLSNLSKGVYLISIQTNGETKSLKFVKQ